MNKLQVFLSSVHSYSAWGRGRVITTLPIQIWANSQFEILGDRRCKMGPKSFWIWICSNNFYKYNFWKPEHKTLEAKYWMNKTEKKSVQCPLHSTAKRKLERRQFSTSSSFVKIWSPCSCEFKVYFWTFWALYHLLFDLETIEVN